MAKAGGEEAVPAAVGPEEAAAAGAASSQVSGPERVTMVHLSDTHNMFCDEVVDALPAADILIHTGDFTDEGTPLEFEHFNKVLEYARERFEHRVVVYGNHDVCHAFRREEAEKMKWKTREQHIANYRRSCLAQSLPAATAVPTLQQVVIKGLRLFGVPWFPLHKGHGGREEPEGLRTWAPPGSTGCIDCVPEGTDVLLTHGPPHGVLDEADHCGVHWGGVPGVRRILAERRPKLHLFGHVHESNGVKQVGETLCVNGGNKNWPQDTRRYGDRLAFPARLFTATRDDPSQPWSIELTGTISLEAASIQGLRRRAAAA
eukprot:TRINITY_DN35660_c0_g1_i1.p1 TRINITY_DN35660_c0_g1~~TRINITY_DN35660_c0_g1_i1.p1  ORF type:complete len:336 (+),score=75.96 TRINITY_DN35660_c0_g1_i1:60-1010(+)